jgi:hypothetical protein
MQSLYIFETGYSCHWKKETAEKDFLTKRLVRYFLCHPCTREKSTNKEGSRTTTIARKTKTTAHS